MVTMIPPVVFVTGASRSIGFPVKGPPIMISPYTPSNTARTFDHFPNACPYRNIHEDVRLVSAVKLADYCHVLDKARLSLLDSFCHSGDRLHIDYYRIGSRWKLCCLKLDSKDTL